MSKVIIIGAGPAGSMAAIAASRAGAKVVLIDKNNEYGKKLSITGNGKCNYSNLTIGKGLDEANYNFTAGSKCDKLIKEYDATWLKGFWKEEGMMTYTKGNLLYPMAEQATSLINTLSEALKAAGVEIKNLEAKQISKSQDKYTVLCTNNTLISGDKVIIATGGKAAPKTGSTGGGYKLARALGHTVSFTYPGLCKLMFDKDKYSYISKASGVRAKVGVKALVCGQLKAYEEGELQILADALSGICVFNLSRFVSKEIEDEKLCELVIDFAPDIETDDLKAFINKGHKQGKSKESILMGIVPAKLAGSLCKEFEEVDALVNALKNSKVEIIGHGSYDEAQVTLGGVSTEEIDGNLESTICPGLFFAGEVLDVDGACGGFNLHWAFASGYKAGICSAN